mmetsp:Transcript_24246/g.57588  ORF Transcript_24246/g.57588 Transcript_24246/m.57588 type:complete len:129 (-) Transcript_24246:116-502(-)
MVECVYSLAGQVHNQGSSALRFVDRDEVIASAVALGCVYVGQSERFRFLAMPLQNAPRLMRRYYHFAALVLYLEFFDVSILKSQALRIALSSDLSARASANGFSGRQMPVKRRLHACGRKMAERHALQ